MQEACLAALLAAGIVLVLPVIAVVLGPADVRERAHIAGARRAAAPGDAQLRRSRCCCPGRGGVVCLDWP